MADTRTIGELVRVQVVRESELNTAVAGYLKKPCRGAWKIAPGVSVDIAAVDAHPFASSEMRRAGATDKPRSHSLRTAILLAQPAV